MHRKLTPGNIRTAADLFAKLRRDSALLSDEVTSDRFFNFVVTGYSLIDWIKNDPSVPAAAKALSEVASLYGNRWITLCGDLATAAKHFELTTRNPITDSTTSEQGFGLGRFGKGAYGFGEEQIEVLMLDGSKHELAELVAGVVSAWEDFFQRHNIG